jgi:protein-S-isoprenylcysteine O-methyltransferase Ste14
MQVIPLLMCAGACASSTWGAFRFFKKAGGLTRRTGIVALLGLSFTAWDMFAIAAATSTATTMMSAALLYALSISLFLSAVRAHGDCSPSAIFELDVPVHLARGGPYRNIRHPFYASYTIYWIAGGVASWSIVAMAAAVVMLGIYWNAIRMEEAKFESSALASDYADYRRRTGRLVPRLAAMVESAY